ncbi:MAG TPA: BPSS1780 family membrane protein [Burkholderiales bacterium]|nr:BPSS1780 family membrane protein [Burkholderiales bacterium]
MRPRILPAAAGARWLTDGWRLFRGAPIGWLALVFAYWLLMTLLSIIPLIGVAIASIAVPALSLGFMAAARASERGARLELGLLFEGLRNGPRPQLALGLVYLACLALVLGATTLFDDGALARWMLAGTRPSNEILQSGDFRAALMAAAAMYAPVMMMFWFAPPLASWHSTGAAKALFFSFFACLMNWRAFLAYGAVTALVALVVPMLLLSAVLLFSGGGTPLPVAGLVFPLLLVLLPTIFASFYASYRDVFGGEGSGGTESGTVQAS